MPKFHHEIFFVSILTSINKIKQSSRNISFENFLEDCNLFDGTLRRLQVIGDSVKSLLGSKFLDEADRTWRDIIAFRNIVVHEYFSLDPEIIFEVVRKEIPLLEKNVLTLIKQMENKTYLLQAMADSKIILSRMRRYEGVVYLEKIEKILQL